MKQFILLSLFIVSSTLSLAQHSRSWTVGTSVSSSLLNDDRLTLSKVSVEPGYQWNERLFVNLSIGYVENMNSALPDSPKFRGVMNSLSVTGRLLEPQYKLSPLVSLEVGNIFYSNAKGATICRDFVLSDNAKNEVMGTFRNFRYIAKLKFMLDIDFLGLNFRFGPNYSFSAVRMYDVRPGAEYSSNIEGFGVEAGLLYSFKSKKSR